MVIVPNTRWAEELNKRELAVSGKTAALEKTAVSIKELLEQANDAALPVISRPMRQLMMMKAMRTVKTVYFRQISKGVADLLMAAVSELKKNSVTPGELKEILATRGGPREADLLAAYEAYEKILKGHEMTDEEALYQDLKKMKFPTPPRLTGFDAVKPWMRAVNDGNIVFDELKVPAEASPRVFSCNSPLAETAFIRSKIDASLADGMAPEDIVVYLPSQNQFAWMLCAAYTSELPFSISTSKIASVLFNNDTLPAKGRLKAFLSVTQERLAKAYSELSEKTGEYVSARELGFIDKIDKAVKRLSFEADELKMAEDLTRDDFLNIFGGELNVSPPWPERLPFRLVPWDDAGLYEHKTAILPQMNEGIFPASGAKISFFSEPDTLSPKADPRIDEIFPKRETQIKRDRTRLQTALRGDVTITFHSHDPLGGDASPSPLIMRYDVIPAKAGISRDQMIETPASAGMTSHGDDKHSAKTCGTNFTSKDVLKTLKEDVEEMTHSATKLEEYGTCPFAYFCRRILRIEPPDEITPEVQPKDRGTLIHASLEDFFVTNCKIYNNYIATLSPPSPPPPLRRRAGVKGGGDTVTSQQLARLVTSSVEKAFEDNTKITSKYDKNMVDHLKKRTISYLVAVLTNEAEILKNGSQRPTRFELEFEGELARDIDLKGVIDRIDEDEKTFTVIDYKTGNTDPVRSGIKEGTELQLPLYTFMAEKLLKKEPAAALLYSIKKQKRATGMIKKELKENVMGKKVSRITVTDNEWDDLIKTGVDTAIRYVEEIKNGRFESAPEKCPSYCDWKDVCRLRRDTSH